MEALKAQRARKFEEAVRLYSEVLAQAKAETRDNDIWLAWGKKACSREIYLAYTHSNRAFCHAQLKQWRPAVQDLSEAIKLNSGNPGNYRNRSAAYRQLGQTDLADADLATYENMLQKEREEKANRIDKYDIKDTLNSEMARSMKREN